MKFSKHFFNELSGTIALAYIFILFGVYPLYMKHGYVGIDADKYTFFLYTALGAVFLLLLSGLSELINSIIQKKFGAVNACILIFAAFSVISYALSSYKDNALVGADGWFMGLGTILIMCVLSYLISILLKPSKYVWIPIIGASFIVFFLGICDRFGFYLINLEIRDNSFISTIGNINWFMGYYSVVAPIGLFFFGRKLSDTPVNGTDRFEKIFLSVYAFTAFCAGFLQGSESVLLFFAAFFVGECILWHLGALSFEGVLHTFVVWGLSSLIVRILRTLFSSYYNYERTGILSSVLLYNIILGLTVAAGVGLWLYHRSESTGKDIIIKRVLSILLILGVISYVITGILNTKGLLTVNIESSLLCFDSRFGSGRGTAYNISADALTYMNLKQLLFGVGPDCFGSFVYSVPDLYNRLMANWPHDILTNSHCEILTMLINEGILGVISYLGIFVSVFVLFVKKCKKPQMMCISLAAFCYLVHNLISFSQELNTPLLFVLIGIANSFSFSQEK